MQILIFFTTNLGRYAAVKIEIHFTCDFLDQSNCEIQFSCCCEMFEKKLSQFLSACIATCLRSESNFDGISIDIARLE